MPNKAGYAARSATIAAVTVKHDGVSRNTNSKCYGCCLMPHNKGNLIVSVRKATKRSARNCAACCARDSIARVWRDVKLYRRLIAKARRIKRALCLSPNCIATASATLSVSLGVRNFRNGIYQTKPLWQTAARLNSYSICCIVTTHRQKSNLLAV